MVSCAGTPGALTSGQVATLDVLVKEMLGRSDRPFAIADVLQRCAEKKLALSEAAITQASALKHWLMTLVMPAVGRLVQACVPVRGAELRWDQVRFLYNSENAPSQF